MKTIAQLCRAAIELNEMAYVKCLVQWPAQKDVEGMLVPPFPLVAFAPPPHFFFACLHLLASI